MQSLRRCRRVHCAPIKKSLSKQALKGTRTRLWSNKTKIAKLSELRKNELLQRGACGVSCEVFVDPSLASLVVRWVAGAYRARHWRRCSAHRSACRASLVRSAAGSFPFPRTKSDAAHIAFHLIAFPMRCMRRNHAAISRNLFLPRLVTKQYVSLSSACNGAFRLKLTYIHA